MARYVGIGFALWAAGTVALRLAGHHIFAPDRPTVVTVTLAASAVLFAVGTRAAFDRQGLGTAERRAASLALVLLPMVLDVASVLVAGSLFPNIAPAMHGPLAAWLMGCYWAILLGGTLPAREGATHRAAQPA